MVESSRWETGLVNPAQVTIFLEGRWTEAASCSVTPAQILILSVSQFWEEWVLIPNLEWEQVKSMELLERQFSVLLH